MGFQGWDKRFPPASVQQQKEKRRRSFAPATLSVSTDEFVLRLGYATSVTNAGPR
jgi:hypothetical protein